MITFTQELTDAAYTEILQGKSMVAFDAPTSGNVLVIMTETETTPSVDDAATVISSWPSDWDFALQNGVVGLQRVWVRMQTGTATITGVRG